MQKVVQIRTMANREKGEATLTVGEQTYTLAVTFQAWAWTQDALVKRGKVPTIEEISDRIGKGQILYTIAFFWGALQKHHPEIDTLDAASEIMAAGGEAVSTALMDAMGLARADPKDIRELDIPANPPVAQTRIRKVKAGTGARSSSQPDASA